MTTVESRARRITKNTLFLFGADFLSRIFTWAQIAYLTRTWREVGVYGQYAVVVNWISIFAIFSELGLNTLVVREVARNKTSSNFYLRNVMVLRIFFSTALWFILIGSAFILKYEPVLKIGMAVLGLRIFLDSLSGGYIYLFQAHEKMGINSFSLILSASIRLFGIMLVVHWGGGVVETCWIWVLASSIQLLVVSLAGYRQGWWPQLYMLHINEVFSVFKEAIPLATFGALQMLYYRVDAVLLKSLSGNESVGYYDLACRVLLVALMLSQQFNQALFPVFSSLQDDPHKFSRLAFRAIKVLVFLGLPITMGGYFLSEPLLVLISGPKYSPSGPLFAVLALSVLFFFLSNVYTSVLAIKNTGRLNALFLVLFLLNVLLNLIFIPRWGALGASWATVVCEIFGIFIGFNMTRPYLHFPAGIHLFKPIFTALAASSIMGLGIFLDPRLYWLVLGPLVYGSGLYLLRAFNDEDLSSLKSIIGLKALRNQE